MKSKRQVSKIMGLSSKSPSSLKVRRTPSGRKSASGADRAPSVAGDVTGSSGGENLEQLQNQLYSDLDHIDNEIKSDLNNAQAPPKLSLDDMPEPPSAGMNDAGSPDVQTAAPTQKQGFFSKLFGKKAGPNDKDELEIIEASLLEAAKADIEKQTGEPKSMAPQQAKKKGKQDKKLKIATKGTSKKQAISMAEKPGPVTDDKIDLEVLPPPPPEDLKPKTGFFGWLAGKPKKDNIPEAPTAEDVLPLTVPELSQAKIEADVVKKAKEKTKKEEKALSLPSPDMSFAAPSVEQVDKAKGGLLGAAKDKIAERKRKLELEIESLERKKRSLESEIRNEEKHIRDLHEHRTVKSKEIEEKHQEIIRKQLELSQKNKMLEQKQQEHDDVHGMMLQKKSAHDALIKNMEKYQADVKRLQDDIRKHSELRDQLKTENAQLKKELNEKERKLNQDEAALAGRAQKIQKLEQELEQSKKEHVEMHELLNRKKVEYESKAQLLGDFEKRKKELEVQIGKMTAEKEHLDSALMETNEQVSAKKNEKQSMSEELKKWGAEAAKNKNEAARAKEALAAANKSLATCNNEIAKKGKMLAQIMKRIEKGRIDQPTKEILGVLDELLGKLPGPTIDEFAHSENFQKYEKVMAKYGLK